MRCGIRLEVDSGFSRTVLTCEPAHFDIPKLHVMIDAELARQEQEAAYFYAVTVAASDESVARDARCGPPAREARAKGGCERDAESPEARKLIGSARDAAEVALARPGRRWRPPPRCQRGLDRTTRALHARASQSAEQRGTWAVQARELEQL